MQGTAAERALLGKSLKLRHQVMVDLSFNLQRTGDIYVVYVLAQILNLFLLEQSEFQLDFSQGKPYMPPNPAFIYLAPKLAHLRAAIAPGERGEISLIIHGCNPYNKSIILNRLVIEKLPIQACQPLSRPGYTV